MRLTATVSRRVSQTAATIVARIGPRVEKGLHAAALVLLRESQRIVPIDTMTLHDSAFVRQTGTGLQTVKRVGYGTKGYKETRWSQKQERHVTLEPFKYAHYVHWDMNQPHDTGEALFLSKPATTAQPEMRAAIRAAIR